MGRRYILHLSMLLALAVTLQFSVSPTFSETRLAKSSDSLEDSVKDLKDALKDLKDLLKGKKTDKPDEEPPQESDKKPSSTSEAPKTQPKPSGNVYIAVSEDGSDTAFGLSANDRLWARASNLDLPLAAQVPEMQMTPPLDINKLTHAQYNGAVSAAMEAMRELMGELTPDEEAKLHAKWAPIFGFPTEESITYLNKLNPLLSEFLSLRGAVATAAIEFDSAWEEAVIAASYDSEEGASEALALAAVQKDNLTALQARMVKIAKAVQTLGNPPDPIQAQQQARKRHQAAIQVSSGMVSLVTISPAKLDGRTNIPCTFTAKMQNIAGKVTLNWVFGDGTVLTGGPASTKHTYTKAGSYVVRVAVYNEKKSKIAEATAKVNITAGAAPAEEKATAWVLVDKKSERTGTLTSYYSESSVKWNVSSTFVECEHHKGGQFWSHYHYSWDDPPARLVPGEKVILNITLKGLPDAKYLVRPMDEAELMLSAVVDQFNQNARLGSAYAKLHNVAVKDEPNKQRREAAEFTIPTIVYAKNGEIRITVSASMAGQSVRNTYLYKPGAGGGATPAVAESATKEDSPDKLAKKEHDKARQETIEFHKSNIKIIEGHLAKDRAELSTETDPARRAALQFRILQGVSDAQAEKDVITSLETGRYVHTRTEFDEYAHQQFIQNIRDNQREMESFQRSSAALYRMAGMLPPGEAQETRDFIDKQLTLDVKTKMDKAAVDKIASALDHKVQGHFQGLAAKSEEEAAWANFGLEAAENIKAGADTGMMVCSLFGGKPIYVAYQASTGYIEGGPTEAVLRSASAFGTAAHTAVEAFRGYQEGGLEAAAKRGAKAYVISKAFEYGASKVMGGAKPAAKRPTVKEQFELAKFKQARSDGESLVTSFQRAEREMRIAARTGKSAKDLIKMQADLRDKAAAINSSPHAKNFLKYKGDYHAQRAYNAQMKAVHADVEAKFHTTMSKQGWNDQKLVEFRNSCSSGSVGMDTDIGLDELAGNPLLKNGQRATVYNWQTDAQKAWDKAYKETTKRSASMSWENITTSAHAESYKDLAWLGSDKSAVTAAWGQQAADVTRYKAWHTLNDKSLSHMEKMQEVSRGTAKDINTKLQPMLNNAKPSSPAAAESLKQARTHWQKIQTTLDAFGKNEIDPITAERRIRELTGGKGIPEVVEDMGTLMEGLLKG